jgi:hypothetical protein
LALAFGDGWVGGKTERRLRPNEPLKVSLYVGTYNGQRCGSLRLPICMNEAIARARLDQPNPCFVKKRRESSAP